MGRRCRAALLRLPGFCGAVALCCGVLRPRPSGRFTALSAPGWWRRSGLLGCSCVPGCRLSAVGCVGHCEGAVAGLVEGASSGGGSRRRRVHLAVLPAVGDHAQGVARQRRPRLSGGVLRGVLLAAPNGLRRGLSEAQRSPRRSLLDGTQPAAHNATHTPREW